MVIIEGSNLERLLELVAPYVSDLGMISNWLNAQASRSAEVLIIELDDMISLENDPSVKTDLRILRNALDRF